MKHVDEMDRRMREAMLAYADINRGRLLRDVIVSLVRQSKDRPLGIWSDH